MKLAWLMVICLACAAAGADRALSVVALSAAVQSPVRVTVGVPYGGASGQLLDLWRPASCPSSGCPAVVWFHGRGGSRTLDAGDYQLRLPAGRGVALAACDYRTPGGIPDSLTLRDAKRCRSWLSRNAAAWDLDSTRVACWGVSLGAYLCNWLTTTCGDTLTGRGGGDECVRGGVSAFGASDLPAIDGELAAAGCPPIARPELTDTARARLASPIAHVSAGSPPWFGLHARDDCVLSYLQTLHLDSAYRAAGAPSWIRLYDGIGHGGPDWSADSIVNPQLTFLQRVLR